MQAVISDKKAQANIGANLRRLRGDRTLAEVAALCSTPEWTCYAGDIEQIESGEHMPRTGKIARIAYGLGVTVDDLLADPPKVVRRRSLSRAS